MKKKILTCSLKSKKFEKKYNYYYVGYVTERERLFYKKKYNNLTFDKKTIDLSSSTKMLRHYNSCEKLYDDIIKNLYKKLNEIHNVKFEKKKWEVILGEWLRQFIYIVYNNYNQLKPQLSSKKYYKIIFNSFYPKHIPSDFNNLINFYNNTLWNEKLNGEIINFIAPKSKKIKNLNNLKIKVDKKKVKNKRSIFKPYNLNKFFKDADNCFIHNTCLPFLEEKKLEMKLGSFPKKWHFPQENLSVKINLKLRNLLIKKLYNNKKNLKNLLLNLLPSYLPLMTIENFEKINNYVDSPELPAKPQYILTSFIYNNNYFLFYVAKKYLENIPIIILQHGNISSIDILYQFSSEFKFAKYLLTWGHQNLKKDRKFFNVNIKRYKPKNIIKNQIGFFCHPLRQHACFSDISENSINEKRLNEALCQLGKIDEKLKDKIFFNLFPGDNFQERKYFENKIKRKGLKVFKDNHFFKIINKTKINIFLYNSTGIYESLALNLPTLVFIENPLKTIVAKYKKTYEYLIKSKIIFTNYKDLIKHIENIWPAVDKWWLSPKVQRNVKAFNREANIRYNKNDLDLFVKKLKLLKM